MFTIAPPHEFVKPADLNTTPARIAIVAEPADDFDVRTDAEWEAMAAEAAAMDAVCSGNPIF